MALTLCAAVVANAAAAQPSAIVEHRVQPGDTLISLLREGADWRPVQRANRIADPRRLRPGSVIRVPEHLLRERPAVAEVVHAHGDVSVARGNAAPAPLAAGASVAAGDVVRTGAQSSATLRFADGARVLVRPDSVLKVERLKRSRAGASTTLQLERGSADSQVPSAAGASPRRYEMRTPQANLGVRGTEFRASAVDAVSRVEVLEGRVGARQGARDAAVNAGFGAVAQASGLATRALPAAPLLAGLPARVERMPLRLAWQGDASASRHRAQVFSSDEPPRLLLDGVFDGTALRWSEDLPDGRYELRVRAIGPEGLEGRDTRAAFVLKARPEPPFAVAPLANARTVDEAPRFAWTRNASATRVRLQIADAPDFAQPRVDRVDLDGSEVRIALPLGTHHWRIASIKSDGDQGPFGDAQQLTRIEPPPAPPPQPPQATDEGLLLRWQGDAKPGTRWQVQVARDAAFSAPLVRDETVTEAQLLLRKPEAGTYFVRVKTIDADGFEGPFGQPQQVDVPRSPWWWLLLPALLLLR